MILVDANLLVYASIPTFREHEAAWEWLEGRLHGTTQVGLPWPSLLTFLRIVTNPRILEGPVTIEDAWEQVRSWLRARPSWVPQPTERHAETLEGLIRSGGARGDLVPDAHLAALAIEHGLVLCSTDRDFSRFPGLRWENPLAS